MIISAKVGLLTASYFGDSSADESLPYLARFRERPVHRIAHSFGHEIPDAHSPNRRDAEVVGRYQLAHAGPPTQGYPGYEQLRESDRSSGRRIGKKLSDLWSAKSQ